MRRGHADHGFLGTDAAARAAFEAVPLGGPDIPVRVALKAASSVRGEMDEGPSFRCSRRKRKIIILGMRVPAQQMREQPVEYATKADIQVLAAEIRGLRESMGAELRAQRESTDAHFEKIEGLLEGQQELIRMLASRIDQVDAHLGRIDAHLDRIDARRESLLKWCVGVLVAAMIGFGGLVFGAARLIFVGGGGG